MRALKGLREHGVTPQTATCVLVAGACGRRHASAVLTDLVTLLITMRRAMGKDEYDQAARACVAAGAPEETLLGEHPEVAGGDPSPAVGGDGSPPATSGLSLIHI